MLVPRALRRRREDYADELVALCDEANPRVEDVLRRAAFAPHAPPTHLQRLLKQPADLHEMSTSVFIDRRKTAEQP